MARRVLPAGLRVAPPTLPLPAMHFSKRSKAAGDALIAFWAPIPSVPDRFPHLATHQLDMAVDMTADAQASRPRTYYVKLRIHNAHLGRGISPEAVSAPCARRS